MVARCKYAGYQITVDGRASFIGARPFTTAARYSADHIHHQRFDSQGRLIIETTRPREPALSYPGRNGRHRFIDQHEKRFAKASTLPSGFFSDVGNIRHIVPERDDKDDRHKSVQQKKQIPSLSDIKDKLKLMETVRELETKLAEAKQNLDRSIVADSRRDTTLQVTEQEPVVLSKQDYMNLVDLYFYSYNSRFSPESPDDSPSPIILDDYSFKLSADFSAWDKEDIIDESEVDYGNPLLEIEEMLKNNQLRQIAVMQVFVELLLDDRSSNRRLYEAYKGLPEPGVAYLPKGVLRLFLQRMSTPWVKTQAAMLRYLALIDDMRTAKLPITTAEWSAAIYLAGRSFKRIKTDEVGKAFGLWKQMEAEAGVHASHVTFNILFDVAVRAGKFALGETILEEMHKRNLRLNRLGRVSLMFYHGLRGDGDGVRKAYHDFVEAGEIVDTLVLNCVIASLINAQEPTAAEQVYQRMKDMQSTLKRGYRDNGTEALFRRHPEPGTNRIDAEMASNHLGRILQRAPYLRRTLPEHHATLQANMPLTPNFTTFRIMIAHHTTSTGDLDRLTVLLKDMLENFDIPLFPSVFQLMFKGFAIHSSGPGAQSPWSKQRLDMVWQACRDAIKESGTINNIRTASATLPDIASLKESYALAEEASANGRFEGQAPSRKLSMWEDLIVDLATFPRERLKRIQRFHAEQFDDQTQVQNTNFVSPFFQETHYTAPHPELDEEEGEYTLPDPVRSDLVKPKISYHGGRPDHHESEAHDDNDGLDQAPTVLSEHDNSAFTSSQSHTNISISAIKVQKYQMYATKPMICWLLRAYTRVTGKRHFVEEAYNVARKIWEPRDDAEGQVVTRVLLRCLQDCDRRAGKNITSNFNAFSKS